MIPPGGGELLQSSSLALRHRPRSWGLRREIDVEDAWYLRAPLMGVLVCPAHRRALRGN
jgi:hypothetical protein